MTRPNIVFVHVDQLHHRALSAYGCSFVRTPGMDRLAAEGVSFMQSYTAMPQCCPARTSWFTGRMSKEHGVVVNGCPIDPSIPDLGGHLRRFGYRTAYAGKWHVSGRNVERSFTLLHRGSGHGELSDTAVCDRALSYLRNRKSSRPFFLSVGFVNPHDCCYIATPYGGPGKYAFAERIKDELPPLPANFDYGYPRRGMPRVRTWSLQDWRYYLYQYYRMVEMVDRELERLYDGLRRSAVGKDTIFIFTADHGDGAGHHAKVGKGYLEEEASRVPAIVAWPGVIPEGVRDTKHLVSGVDIAATVCDYAGVPPLPCMTVARSWRPLLRGQSHSVKWRPYVVCETSVGSLAVMIRDIRYKSILTPAGGRLYDLSVDPLERKNLWNDPRMEEVLKRHRSYFKEYVGMITLYEGPQSGRTGRPRKRSARDKARRMRPELYDAYLRWYRAVRAGR